MSHVKSRSLGFKGANDAISALAVHPVCRVDVFPTLLSSIHPTNTLPRSSSFYSSPHASSPASTAAPATGLNEPAPPVVGLASAEPLPAALPPAASLRLPISCALTPVPLTHWSSARSWAVLLKMMSAHCGVLC
jgi:hypothetical protein